MSERGKELFNQLQGAQAIRALIGQPEDAHLDCKEWPNDRDAQSSLAKAACGLTNAEGGVLIVGMKARPTSKEDPDLIESAAPVAAAVGLPQLLSENEWETFRGGADEVIYPEETRKIAQLTQRGAAITWDRNGQARTRWAFEAVTFQCEISCEGAPTKTVEKTIPENAVAWP